MSACSCQGRRCQKIQPGNIRWFWRALSHPSELCEGGAYESPSRWSTSSLVICLRCLHRWRTQAKYAEQLPEPNSAELANIGANVALKDACQTSQDRPAKRLVVPVADRQHTDYKMRAAGDE